MLTFSSEIHVKPECDRVSVLSLLNDWFLASQLSSKWLSKKQCSPFDIYKNEPEFCDSIPGITVDVMNEPDFLLVQFQTENEEFIRNTFCIFREQTEEYQQTFYVGETLDAKKFGATFDAAHACLYAREIVQHIFWNDYQEEFDGNIINSDRTIFLTGSNIKDYIPVLTGAGKEHANPFLYVPYKVADMVQKFERPFVGQLHILAEGSPLTAGKITELSDGQAVPTDSIFLKWHDGTVKQVSEVDTALSDIDKVVDKIQLDLQDVLSSCERNERFSISHLREEKLLSKLGTDPDLSAVFDSIIKDKEHEIANLSQEVTALRKQLHEEKIKADALQNSYSKSESDGQEGMFELTEVPKYDHEIEDIILRVLEKERDGMSSDPTLIRSRKYHVLCDILAHNFPSDTGTELEQLIKEVFATGRLTRDGIGRLQSAGFTVEKNDRQAHYKIAWKGDDRYVSTYAATASDYRSGKNAASDYVNLCLGY